MPNKIKIVALVGKSATGKDIIAKMICKDKRYHPIVSTTTRPKRDKEIDGVDYHFVSSQEFGRLIETDKMLEATIFNDWCYGTSLDSLSKEKINIGVYNPEGLDLLSSNPNIELFVIYVHSWDKTRLLRQLNREYDPDVKEIIRRFSADAKDFSSKEKVIPSGVRYIEVMNNDKDDLRQIKRLVRKLLRQLGTE